MMNQTFDLVIVGGGMVGSALACALKDSDLSVAVIEPFLACAPVGAVNTVGDVDMRVSALNRSSQRFLTSVGAWQAMNPERLNAYDKMRVWDGEGTGHIQFDAVAMGEPQLGHIVENRVTAAALLAQMQLASNVTLISGATVEKIERYDLEQADSANETYFLTLDQGQCLQTRLVVAADGARSFVRDWLQQQDQADTREWDYGHHGLVCTVQTEQPHQNCAWQRFTETGVLAFLPIQDADHRQNLCSIVWSCPESQANELLALGEEAFNAELAKAFEYQLGDVMASGKKAAIPLRQRHAKRYVHGGVVLVGDAAHTIHPLAGQGVNLGLMDAYVLADEIKQGLARGLAPCHSQILARYERRRMPENLTMMSAMESFKRLFAVKTPWLRWARNWGMSKVNQLDFIKNHVIQEAMGLNRTIR